ncbi:hypothetical protein K7640_22425 [Micromonospora sp. PLK6-60]|uniref:hypothetical protein n=1 Tax=Micromonospora sp. PLK6-60 TaxID=2873383 RepID=UPI001CA7A243|nr:hypothetical protein [Micromonospora sp. PLK6-60]MBY8874588.1 hypothetical protein [Micromonospora sp. PLK6-60]
MTSATARRPGLRPAAPDRRPITGTAGPEPVARLGPGQTVEALAVATSALTPVSWAGVLFGGWLLTHGAAGTRGTGAAAWGAWLTLTGPVALLLTAAAAVTLRWRGSSGPASVFGAVALVGTVGAALWPW